MNRFQKSMKSAFILCATTLFACLLAGRTSVASVDTPNPKDLTQGNWDMQPDKSKYCNAKTAPKSSTRSIFDAGWGLIVTEWGGVGADGKPIVTRYVARYDGQKYPANITKPDSAEAIVWKLVDPRRLEFTHYDKADKVTSTYVRTVSPDGQEMTQISTFVGQECKDVQVFKRR